MAIWANTTKTSAGLALDLKLLRGGIPLSLTRAESGTGKVNPTQLPLQTAVSSPAQALELKDVILSSIGTTVTLPVLLSNAGLAAGYTLYQVGIYATDPNLGEILYIIAQTDAANGELVPSATDSPGFTIDWNFGINNANGTSVNVTLDEAGKITLSQGDLRYGKKADLATLEARVNDFNLTDQLTNYYTKQILDGKLKTYYTALEVDSKITTAITNVLGGEY